MALSKWRFKSQKDIHVKYDLLPSTFPLGNDFIFFTRVTSLPLIHKEFTLSLNNLFTLKASLPHLCWYLYLHYHLFPKPQTNYANFYWMTGSQWKQNRIYLSIQSYPFTGSFSQLMASLLVVPKLKS